MPEHSGLVPLPVGQGSDRSEELLDFDTRSREESASAPNTLVRTISNILIFNNYIMDSKSAGGNPLRVQVSLPVPKKIKGLGVKS